MKPTIEVLIGSPLVGEEARFLVCLCSDLSRSNNSNSILVLANFEVPAAVKSRQLDFLIISDSNRGLVELKCFRGPVFGSENGVWKLRDFSGQTVPYPGENPWSQTVQAKFALSDAMSDFSRGYAGIPSPVNQSFYKEFDATVCIFPNIHPQSRITTGNFKAWVRGYNDFLTQFNKRTVNSNWTLDHWRRLAIEGLSLRPVPLHQAIDPDALVAADSVGTYCSALGSSLRQLPTVRAWPKGQTYGEDLVQRLSGSDNVMLIGPSGCGKSFHVSHAVLSALESEEVPVVVRPKWYRGADFWDLVQQAIAPYHRGSAKAFLSHVVASGRRPLLVADGVNECPSRFIGDLHRGVRAFLTQFGARLVAAGQHKSDVASDLIVRVIEMSAPSIEQKCAIYDCYAKHSPDKDVLMGLTNAYDVRLAAMCAGGEPDLPRVALYDRYCRAHLPGDQQIICLALLRRVAEEIDRDVALSISRDRFDRVTESFVEREEVSLSIVDELRGTRLLDVSNDAVSFEHELLLNYFRAECLRRRCPDINALEKELNRPLNRDLLEFVVPRLSEPGAMGRALSTCKDPTLITRSLQHRCGQLVFQIASADCLQVLETAINDLPNLSIHIDAAEFDDGKRAVTWAHVEGNREWTRYESTLFQGILDNIADEQWRSRLLALYEATEVTLIHASEATAKEQNFRVKAVLRETLRCLGFLSSESLEVPGLILVRGLRTQTLSAEAKAHLPKLADTFVNLFKSDNRRQFSLLGAIHSSLEMCYSHTPPSVDICLDLLRMSFENGVFMTRLDALMLLRFMHSHVVATCPDQIKAIREALESLDTSDPLVNTDIMEVLATYDALEPIVSVQDAATEFRKFINPLPDFCKEISEYTALHPESGPEQILASGAYGTVARIFEDIFQGAYSEAYEMLSIDERAKLLGLAANAERTGIHKDWIFAELLRLNDSSSVDVFKRFAATFDSRNPFLNESISTFIISILGCARFLQEPPEMHGGDRIDERAWLLIGKIIFWHERRQKDEGRATQYLRELWAQAHDTVAVAIPDVLQHLHRGIRAHLVANPPDLIHTYPEEIQTIFEEALRNAASISSLWFNPGVLNKDAIHFTISVLSEIGDSKSADLIGTLVDDPVFGESAVRAVRLLRGLHPR